MGCRRKQICDGKSVENHPNGGFLTVFSLGLITPCSDRVFMTRPSTQAKGKPRNRMVAVDPITGNPLQWDLHIDLQEGILHRIRESAGNAIGRQDMVSSNPRTHFWVR